MERKVKYDVSFKLKCIQLILEKYHSINSVTQQYGVPQSQVKRWLQSYRALGINGLISCKNKSYTCEFKLLVIRTIELKSLSLSEARFRFNIPSDSVIVQWQRKYATFGLDGLKPKRKGRPPNDMSNYKRKVRKSDKPLTREEELLIENEKLRCENAFLEKFNALVQAQKQAEAQQKHKFKPSKD